MFSIFGDLFDFDGDGKLNAAEQAAELIVFDKIWADDTSDSNEFDEDTDFDDDFDGDDY